MREPPLRSCVYIKMPNRKGDYSEEVVIQNLKVETDQLRDRFEDVVVNDFNLSLAWDVLPWPHPELEAPEGNDFISESPLPLSLNHLEQRKYDGDLAICVVPSPTVVDAAIGRLALRTQKYTHICICSLCPLPPSGSKDARKIWDPLATMPRDSMKATHSDSEIHIPFEMDAEGNVKPSKNAWETGELMLRSFDQYSISEIRKIISDVAFNRKLRKN